MESKRIGLIARNSIEYIEQLIDIWNIGACAVLVDKQIPLAQSLQFMQFLNVEKCYLDIELYDSIPPTSLEIVPIHRNAIHTGWIPNYVYDQFIERYDQKEAVILFSSGTTGKEKGIILSHDAINTNADMINEYMNLNQKQSMMIVKSFCHSSTLTGELLVCLKNRIRSYICGNNVMPRNLIYEINNNKITHLCLNPSLLDIITRTLISTNSNICLEEIYSSGSPLEIHVYNRAKEAMPNVSIYNVYGLSEAGPRVCAQHRKDNNIPGSVGKPLSRVMLKITDRNGNTLEPYMKGSILIKTPSIFSGYAIAAQNKIDYRQSVEHGYFETGDRGYVDYAGNLFITGRLDNCFMHQSHKIYAEDIECILLSLNEFSQCIVVGNDKKIICYYSGDYEMDQDHLWAFKEKCLKVLAPYEIPNVFIFVNKFQISHSGKIIRRNYKI